MVEEPDRTVFVVEDEPRMRTLLAYILGANGYAVVEAPDGAEAIRLVDTLSPPEAHFCAILLDMRLPKVSGLDILRHLTARQVDVPVVAISASPALLDQAMRAGATAAVAKPFRPGHLLSIIASYGGPTLLIRPLRSAAQA